MAIPCTSHQVNLIFTHSIKEYPQLHQYVNSISNFVVCLRKKEFSSKLGSLCPLPVKTRWLYIIDSMRFIIKKKLDIKTLLLIREVDEKTEEDKRDEELEPPDSSKKKKKKKKNNKLKQNILKFAGKQVHVENGSDKKQRKEKKKINEKEKNLNSPEIYLLNRINQLYSILLPFKILNLLSERHDAPLYLMIPYFIDTIVEFRKLDEIVNGNDLIIILYEVPSQFFAKLKTYKNLKAMIASFQLSAE